MQVYKLFFQVLRKQKGQIIMYLVIFLSVALAAASQGEKTGGSTFSPTTYKFAVMDADNSEISIPNTIPKLVPTNKSNTIAA